jgi:hypothetical protein
LETAHIPLELPELLELLELLLWVDCAAAFDWRTVASPEQPVAPSAVTAPSTTRHDEGRKNPLFVRASTHLIYAESSQPGQQAHAFESFS